MPPGSLLGGVVLDSTRAQTRPDDKLALGQLSVWVGTVGDEVEGMDDKLVAALMADSGTVAVCRCGTGRVADRQCLRALVTRARL